MFLMNRITDSLIETFVHAIPSVCSFNLEFLFIKCLICNDQLIALVLYLYDIALSLEPIN